MEPSRGSDAGTDENRTTWRYRVLPAQHGMILDSLRFPDDGVDVIQIVIDWDGPLDRADFTEAWRGAVARHDVLRTSFRLNGTSGDAALVQVVAEATEPDLRWIARDPDGDDAFIRADRRERFDSEHAPLLRVTVLDPDLAASAIRAEAARAGATGTEAVPVPRIVVTFHHAILDGRSFPILLGEVFAEYAARRAGRPITHPIRRPFREFVEWWDSADLAAAEEFWRSYLAEPVVARSLPGHRGERVSAPAEPESDESVLSVEESEGIRAAAAAAGVGVNTMVCAAWALLRAGYGGVRDVVFAITRSCRYASVPDADGIVGVLINTVPVRVFIDPQWTVNRFLDTVGRRVREVRDHQRAPLASILGWAGLAADTAVLDSLVVFDRHLLHTGLVEVDPDFVRRPVHLRRLPSYPLTFYAFDEPDIRLSAIWDRGRLVDGAARTMLAQLRTILVEMSRRPEVTLSRLAYAAPTEAATLAGWNDTARPYPREATIPELFAARVAADPDAVALVAGVEEITYAELDRRTDRLAGVLLRAGVARDEPVVVAMPRGALLVQTLLAVLKAGGAYVPVDLGSPAARMVAMIGDSGGRLVLTAAGTAGVLPDIDGVTVRVIAETDPTDERLPAVPPPPRAHPLSLAYISYTSGSTGVPKGVAIAHRAVVRLVSDPDFATLRPGQRLLHLAPTAFDASTLEIWGALLTGATVVVAPPGPLGLLELAALLRGGGISLVWLTAGLFHQLVEVDAAALAGIPQLLAGGDVLSPDAVRAALVARAGLPVINGYGPTENTTFTTCHPMREPGDVGDRVPIGRPIRQTTVHILDPDGRPAPIGVAGELCTGGDGLARGYVGRASATARAFVPDPFGSGERLYRTGDLARWRADGVVEFIGRVDDQIKIRGFRVEPAEVEAALRTHPDIQDVVVVVRGGESDRHLVGYVTAIEGVDPATLRPGRLREFLARRLPEYLVPAGFAVLDRLPLNVNGKVNRAALPPPDRDVRETGPVEPRTPTEEALVEMWRQLMPTNHSLPADIGREESFFALGGNSLGAARLMFRIRETFGVEVSLGDFYRAPTLAECAAAVDVAKTAAVPVAARGIVRRDRRAHRVSPSAGAAPETGGGSTVPVASPGGIVRRDRSAHRVPSGPAPIASHMVPLDENWGLWRTVCVRGAGLPADLPARLADARLADAADAVLAARADAGNDGTAETAYQVEFGAAAGRLGRALRLLGAEPAIREAIAWQNRHGLATGIDSLLRRDPDASRNTKHRQHEALLASYLQRYCVKNDTIGFFGPVGWGRVDDGTGIRVTHAPDGRLIAARTVYLEGWAVTAALAGHVEALRPWLVPRRMPFIDVVGGTLRVPLAPPVRLGAAEAAVLRACDGARDATEVATLVLADPTAGLRTERAVFDVLAALATAHRLAWGLDVPPHDIRPERTMRARLERVTDPAVRGPALAALDELTAARDVLASASGDADRVAEAMAGLETTFTALAGAMPTRRSGEQYAGRTVAYEECLRADVVDIGESALVGLREPLSLVLAGARWFTATSAALYRRLLEDVYRRRAAELGTEAVPFADFWIVAGELLFEPPRAVIGTLVRALDERWADVLRLPEGERRIRLSTSDLRDRVATAFAATGSGWPSAVHHSPDLMVTPADDPAEYQWIMGELHPGIVTMRYAAWLAHHESPETVRAGMADDLGRGAVFLAETGERGGAPSRLSNALVGPRDLRLVFAHDSCGHDPAGILTTGECEVVATPAGLRVRRRDGLDRDIMDVLGDLIAAGLTQHYRVVAPGTHTPRVSIGDLVVSRESWAMTAARVPFAEVRDEAERFVRARAWAAAHDFPRHVFVRCVGERKPIYADLTSLASIDLVARAVRRARRHAGDDAPVTVVEMLPTPDQLWLRDSSGRRYSAELRMVAVDRTQKDRMRTDRTQKETTRGDL